MLTNDELRAVLINEARRLAGDKADDYPDVDERMLQDVMTLARAVERAAYEEAAQECESIREDGDASDWETYHDGCTDCANAIRALGADK